MMQKDINSLLKEIQENTSKQVEALKEETQKSLKELQKNNQTGEVIEQNHPGSKNGSRDNKEITKGDNSGDRNPRREIRSNRCKHHQQNTRNTRENLGYRRYNRNIDITAKENEKCKKLLT
jgi:methyl-accepting chemotaxis protein